MLECFFDVPAGTSVRIQTTLNLSSNIAELPVVLRMFASRNPAPTLASKGATEDFGPVLLRSGDVPPLEIGAWIAPWRLSLRFEEDGDRAEGTDMDLEIQKLLSDGTANVHLLDRNPRFSRDGKPRHLVHMTITFTPKK